jgi:WD40 repeat protein
MVEQRVIANRYRLVKSLGKGTFGEVFEALDEKFQPPRQVAIKLLHPQFLADQEVRDSIRQEAGNLARFSHPNILRVHDFEVRDELAFLVTDIAVGGSLMDKLRPNANLSNASLTVEEVLRVLQHISGALDEAHANGLIHRDIKPQNILLDKWNNYLLADFGLATAISSTATSMMVNAPVTGTPLYMAPEQWEGASGKPSDIYALGVLTFQMLTGEPPFRGNNMALAFQHLNTTTPKLKDRAALLKYNPALDEVIAQAMAKKPQSRPKSATEFYQKFKKALEAPVPTVNIEDLLKEVPVFTTPPPEVKPLEPSAIVRGTDELKQTVSRPTPIMLTDHAGCVNAIAWSRDGSLLASASFDRTVRLWRANGALYTTLQPHFGDVSYVAWSKDSTQIVTGCENGSLHIWSVYGTLMNNLNGHSGRISDIEWSPSGQRFATAAFDRHIIIWRLDGKAHISLSGHTMPVKKIAWSPNSQLLASASNDKTARIWTDTGKLVAVLAYHNAGVWDVAWSPNGRMLITVSMDNQRQVGLWLPDGRLHNACNGHKGAVSAVAWSPHGHFFATASWDKSVIIWQANGGLFNTLLGHKDMVTAVAWSPDGKLLASASNDETVRIWGEDGSLKAILEGHKEPITALAWSPDSHILATASADCKVGLWSMTDAQVYEWPK